MCAQRLEDLVGAREIGLRLFDDAAERLEDMRAARSTTRADSRLDRQAAEVLSTTRRACRVKSRSSGRRSAARLRRCAIGDARVGTGDARSAAARRRRRCAPSARRRCSGDHRIADGQRGTRPGDGRKPTTLQKLRGIAQRAAHVAAVGDRQHAARERDRRAAAAAAAGLREVVRIARRAEDRVERLRAGAELRRVGLADDDRAGARAMRSTISASCVGHEVAEDRRAVRRADARVSTQVLVRDRQPVQRADGSPRAIASSARARRAIARSATSVTIALTAGFTRSIRARCAVITSRAESCFARRSAASSTALIAQISDIDESPEKGTGVVFRTLKRPRPERLPSPLFVRLPGSCPEFGANRAFYEITPVPFLGPFWASQSRRGTIRLPSPFRRRDTRARRRRRPSRTARRRARGPFPRRTTCRRASDR